MHKWFSDIEDEWASFEENVVPEEAGRRQRQEMRMAFICGYWTCLLTMRSVPDELDQELAAAALEEQFRIVESKVRVFAREVKKRGDKK